METIEFLGSRRNALRARGRGEIFAGAFLATLLVAAPAAAQAPLLNTFGGTLGYGTSCLSPNDDGSSAIISLLPAFPAGLRFFTMTHTSAYVNTNGNITFSGPEPIYTPDPFPVAARPMIAPYWADVDIRLQGGVCMGGAGTSSRGDLGCSNPPENGVWWYLEPGRMVVTWDRTGYYTCHNNLRMSFQLVLTAAPSSCGGDGDFDVEFRYNRCEWTTGDASGGSGGFGGTPAQAGFDAGDGVNFVEIMGSRTGTIHTILCTMSNLSPPETGIWRFSVRGGTIYCLDAGLPCTLPGLIGACAEGRTNCVGMGTECQPFVTPTPERCDALDNDCNGVADDGTGLCGNAWQVCERGVCLEPCLDGCPVGETCTATGVCVDDACASVTCPTGQRCEGGVCVGACDGVVCPARQVCFAGSCIDACAGLTCDACSTCVDGMCVTRCPARMCLATETCTASGACVETACMGVTCPPGEVCGGGVCSDACAGAMCPRGQRCETGACVPIALPDAGMPDSGLPDVSQPDGDDATGSDGGVDADPGAARRRGGCACRVTAGGEAGSQPWLGALLAGFALALILRRRR